MAEGLQWSQVRDPAYLFEQGAEFVQTFGQKTGAELINPMDHPAQFAEAVALLNPRHPKSVFNVQGAGQVAAGEYADRYAQADNGLPVWAAAHENVINDAAHRLGIRDRELGTTFQHDFAEGGEFDVGLVLEGANNASENRARALADAVAAGRIAVGRLLIAGTDREVGEREGHPGLTIGHEVARKVAEIIRADYPETFGEGGIPVDVLHVRTHAANARDVVTEAVLRTDARSIAMTGSKIYGSWMRTDMATVQHTLNGLESIDFGAGPDDPKAPRTARIWAAEVAQTLVSAAHLRQAHLLKKRN